VKYWEIIADNLSKAGWSWGCVATIDFNGQTIFVADAHPGVNLISDALPFACGMARQMQSSTQLTTRSFAADHMMQ
jgi:hypothetical protein